MIRLLLVALLALSAFPATAAPVTVEDVIVAAIENYIRPNFHQLAMDAAALGEATGELCASPSEAALAKSRDGFKATVLAFAKVEFVHVGPLGVEDRLERMLFWPDRKGIALKQVQAILGTKDDTATDPATLRGKSVAVQGLGALEYALFGSGAEELATEAGAFRCSYAKAVTTLISDLSTTMDKEWADPAGVTEAMVNPKPDATDYRTQTEVIEKLTATLVHGTDIIRDQRVMPIIGAKGDAPKPKSALFWRSEMTAPMLAADFAGLHEFFGSSRLPELMGLNNSWIANGTDFEFENAARAVGDITLPIDKAVEDPEQRKALDYLIILTGSLDTLVGENLAASLGLSVGFSSLDGD